MKRKENLINMWKSSEKYISAKLLKYNKQKKKKNSGWAGWENTLKGCKQ